jgi:hypothetical protein
VTATPSPRPTAARDARAAELARLGKAALLALMTERATERGASWVLGGPVLWSKDELVDGILALEYPPALCICRCHQQSYPPDDPHCPLCLPGLAVILPPCPEGCGCRLGADDADRRECGCDGPCTGGGAQ